MVSAPISSQSMRLRSLPSSLLIKNATVLDPAREKEFEGEILLRNGKIEKVAHKGGPDISSAGFDGEELDAHGKVVTHGFCDLHAHFREPGREDKETLFSGARAALAGG